MSLISKAKRWFTCRLAIDSCKLGLCRFSITVQFKQCAWICPSIKHKTRWEMNVIIYIQNLLKNSLSDTFICDGSKNGRNETEAQTHLSITAHKGNLCKDKCVRPHRHSESSFTIWSTLSQANGFFRQSSPLITDWNLKFLWRLCWKACCGCNDNIDY